MTDREQTLAQKVLPIDLRQLDAPAARAAIARAAALLRAGGLVAFPTETVYGLGANAADAAAVRRIFAAKGRPADNPLIVHLASAAQIDSVAARVPALAARLAAAFWPGPLTLVLPRGPGLTDLVTAGLDTVAVRVPSHPVARALLAAAEVPVAAPSANLSTRVSPTAAAHVIAQLGAAVDLLLDAGPCAVGIESTVLEIDGERARLLRPGGLPVAVLEQVAGPIDRTPPAAAAGPRRAPGMLGRHYAPGARLIGFAAADRAAVWERLAAGAAAGTPCGLIAFDVAGAAAAPAIEMPRDAAGYARQLFAALHRVDAAGCEQVYVELPPGAGDWEAVADRLRRAGVATVTGGSAGA